MNRQILEFFRAGKGIDTPFTAVRFLSEESTLSWTEAEKMGVSKAWFELSRIPAESRIEFVKDLWLKSLSFHTKASDKIEGFFERLDDVIILVCQHTVEDPWRAEMIYSVEGDVTFFRGLMPATDDSIVQVKKELELDLPLDYWNFSKIHNGFGRLSELGMMPIEALPKTRSRFVRMILDSETPLRMGAEKVDAYSLFPFYEEFGLDCYQCFNGQWYPESEMGNVHFSGIDYTVSDTLERREWAENLAFPTFVEWLAAFLEGTISCI